MTAKCCNQAIALTDAARGKPNLDTRDVLRTECANQSTGFMGEGGMLRALPFWERLVTDQHAEFWDAVKQ